MHTHFLHITSATGYCMEAVYVTRLRHVSAEVFQTVLQSLVEDQFPDSAKLSHVEACKRFGQIAKALAEDARFVVVRDAQSYLDLCHQQDLDPRHAQLCALVWEKRVLTWRLAELSALEPPFMAQPAEVAPVPGWFRALSAELLSGEPRFVWACSDTIVEIDVQMQADEDQPASACVHACGYARSDPNHAGRFRRLLVAHEDPDSALTELFTYQQALLADLAR